MYRRYPFRTALAAFLLVCGCECVLAQEEAPARQEVVEDFASLVPVASQPRAEPPAMQLVRITTAVPWPRGLVLREGELIVLARGRHRRAGGVDPAIDDRAGSLFAVDPTVSEPVIAGEMAGWAVRENARLIAEPTAPPFRLYNKENSPREATLIDRPYCTLVYDERSRNFFICGFSGVDLAGGKFRKNASDSIHRYDLRDGRWHPVEMHDATIVPEQDLGYVVSNTYYPHHDPESNPPPHGWLNGADGGCVAGEYLYITAKDNHRVVQYDLHEIRQNAAAGVPESRPVLGSDVEVSYPGGQRQMRVLGPSAAVTHEGYLYIGYRTSSVVLRFEIDERGDMIEPAVGELIAVFEPWSAETERSANLIDLAFNENDELFVSCAKQGRIWNVGKPDPAQPFYGDDQSERPTTAAPWVDLPALLAEKAACGNITFDESNRMYLCTGEGDTESKALKGAVYRVNIVPGGSKK